MSDIRVGPWREMTQTDLAAVEYISDLVHPAYPEDVSVMAERRRLYPAGCLVLPSGKGILGYTVSHPWLFGQPPKLNTRLERLPVPAETYYIHDVALLPEARGTGAGGAVVRRLALQAQSSGLANLSLVAVNGSVAFWQRHGFGVAEDAAITSKLQSYGVGSRFMVRPLPGAPRGSG
jgi:GNAT superfamily N-acetyltransferase